MNVLLIEDDLDFRRSLTKGLESKGAKVFFVSSLEEFKEFEAPVEITHAVVDLRLQLESGLDFIPLVRERFSDAFILMLTAYGSITTSVEAIKRGANEYLLKPCSFKDLYYTLVNKEKPETSSFDGNDMLSLYQKEKEYIDFVLQQNQGNISKSADVLGIRRQSLQRKLKKYGEKKIE